MHTGRGRSSLSCTQAGVVFVPILSVSLSDVQFGSMHCHRGKEEHFSEDGEERWYQSTQRGGNRSITAVIPLSVHPSDRYRVISDRSGQGSPPDGVKCHVLQSDSLVGGE
ncbi:hypothetical protein ACOMHN_000801 [Nucella lapillus]